MQRLDSKLLKLGWDECLKRDMTVKRANRCHTPPYIFANYYAVAPTRLGTERFSLKKEANTDTASSTY